MTQSNHKGFTLIELLVVIAIVAILSVVVVLSLNPAELLKQARDSTRISDMATLKSAIGLYLADVSTPDIGNTANCYAHASSTNAGGATCTNRFAAGTYVVTSTLSIDGTGWIPINFTSISSGAPISAVPADPVNNATYYYAYRPGASFTYELNAQLESTKFTSSTSATDGGNNAGLYEVGTEPGLNN